MSVATKLLLSGAPQPTGSQVFTSGGTWTCPDYVYSVSVVCIGRGGNAGSFTDFQGITSYYYGGGGGGLGWRNNIAVTPGQTYTVGVGDSYFVSIGTVRGAPGGNGTVNVTGAGGTFAGDGGFIGGDGGGYTGGTSNRVPGGGGGAANYDSNGSNGEVGTGPGPGTGVSSNNDGPYGGGGSASTAGQPGVVQIRWGVGKGFP